MVQRGARGKGGLIGVRVKWLSDRGRGWLSDRGQGKRLSHRGQDGNLSDRGQGDKVVQ